MALCHLLLISLVVWITGQCVHIMTQSYYPCGPFLKLVNSRKVYPPSSKAIIYVWYSNILILIGRNDLSLLRIPIILEDLFATFSECFSAKMCVYV